MIRRLLCIGLCIGGLVVLGLPAAASADGLQGYQVKLTGWPTDQAGVSVAIGDVNGDGVPDYIIGDPDASPNQLAGAGSVYVIYGEAGDTTTPRTVNLRDIPLEGQGSSSLGYRIDGWSPGDHFGFSVAVGDVNGAVSSGGDRIDDIIVGDPDGSPLGRYHAGEIYVIYGQPGTSTPELDVSSMSPSQGVLFDGWAPGDETGYAVAAGNFNNQVVGEQPNPTELDSIAFSAPDATPNGNAQAGEVYVVYGNANWYGTYGTDKIDLSTYMSQGLGYFISSPWPGDQLGASLADGGDVNGDGTDALLIGDPMASPDGMWQAGSVYVIWGRQGTDNSNISVDSVGPGGVGYRIDGPSAGSHYGFSVANAGDIDGDGIDDVLAGAPNWDYGGGEAVLTYGQDSANAVNLSTVTLSASNDPSVGFAIQGATKDYTESKTEGTVYPDYFTNACTDFSADQAGGSLYPNATTVTAEGDRVGTSVGGLGVVGTGNPAASVLVGAPGWDDSAGAVFVIHEREGETGRQQINIQLAALNEVNGYELTDADTPAGETPVFGPPGTKPGNPFTGAGGQDGQIIEQTEEAFDDFPLESYTVLSPNYGWVYCSNYMWEPGAQAGSAAAATGTGSGGLALIGAPTYGTTPNLAWSGDPQNPTVWFDPYPLESEVGGETGGSGEADWNQTEGSGAAYVLAF